MWGPQSSIGMQLWYPVHSFGAHQVENPPDKSGLPVMNRYRSEIITCFVTFALWKITCIIVWSARSWRVFFVGKLNLWSMYPLLVFWFAGQESTEVTVPSVLQNMTMTLWCKIGTVSAQWPQICSSHLAIPMVRWVGQWCGFTVFCCRTFTHLLLNYCY